MIEKAYAKINISLNIIGKRADGYHELDMIMVPVSLYDTVHLNRAEEMSFESNTSLGWNEGNLMYRAVELMKDRFDLKSNYRVRLIKRIPEQAGMAGGSADCAAILRLINRLEKFGLTDEQLAEIGVSLGADVPFCVHQKPARVQGIGEKIRLLGEHDRYDVIIVKPSEGVSTGRAFALADSSEGEHPDMDKVEECYLKQEGLEKVMGNTLQKPAISLVPVIGEIIEEARSAGFDKVLMTGSGSAVFMLIDGNENVRKMMNQYQKKYKFVTKCHII